MTHTLRLERRLAHRPEKVFRALVEPEQLSRWYPLTVVELDARVGGTIRFRDEDGTELRAEITELNPPKLFGFTEIDEEGAAHDMRLEVVPDEPGSMLVLTHTFEDPTWNDRMEAGWYGCLSTLAELLDNAA